MKTFLCAVLACLAGLLAAAHLNAQLREANPVILKGSELSALQGLSIDDIVGFNYGSGDWTQIAIQIDERDIVNGTDIYFESGICNLVPQKCSRINIDLEVYTDANTFTGPDSDPNFDADDELVFMADKAGGQAPPGSYPATVDAGAARVEVELTDPINSAVSYVYLFENTDDLDPSAGVNDVTYNFVLLAGSYSNYRTGFGTNPENSVVTTPSYRQHFADRWIKDEINVFLGSGVDILDRHKTLFPTFACSHTDEGYSYGEGAFIANIDGPIRAIRSYLGSLSGPLTQRDHIFYSDNEEIVTYLRVHAIQGNMDIYDYSPNASGMTYYNNLNQAGVTIDGVDDAVVTGILDWEMVSGEQGTMFMTHQLETNIDLGQITSRYVDNVNNVGADACTGDDHAYGFSGPELLSIPDTDPATSPENFLTARRKVLYKSGNKVPDDCLFFLQQQQQALIVVTSSSGGSTCNVPGSLRTDQISKVSARANWGSTSALSYTLRWRPIGAPTWTTVSGIAQSPYTITGLVRGSSYEWQVRSDCSGESSAFSASTVFSTLVCDAALVPTGLVATPTSSSSADFDWDDMEAQSYHLQIYKVKKNGTLSLVHENTSIPTNSYSYAGLNDRDDYAFRVRSLCLGVYSAWSANVVFTLSGAKQAATLPAVTGLAAGVRSGIYPNPVVNSYRHEIQSDRDRELQVEWRDAQGRLLRNDTWRVRSGLNVREFTLIGMAAGVYTITIKDESGRTVERLRLLKH